MQPANNGSHAPPTQLTMSDSAGLGGFEVICTELVTAAVDSCLRILQGSEVAMQSSISEETKAKTKLSIPNVMKCFSKQY